MTIDPKIQQLSKYDFFEYIQQLQILAKEKYSFDIFIENRLPEVNSIDIDENKQTTKPLDNFMKSKGILKNVDLSDISEKDIYLQKS